MQKLPNLATGGDITDVKAKEGRHHQRPVDRIACAQRLPRQHGHARVAKTAVQVEELAEFDQGTSAADLSFRTNAYPAMAWDDRGRLYLAWTERGFSTAPLRGSPIDASGRFRAIPRRPRGPSTPGTSGRRNDAWEDSSMTGRL